MTRKDWEKIVAARDLLGLAEKATLAEIKKAYRRMSKKHHPDVAESRPGDEQPVAMH
jgi:DnaJ-class molecular chaperone